MIDSKTLAYINLFGVLGALENLTELDPGAAALLTNTQPLSLAFDVLGGPKATLTFQNGRVRLQPGVDRHAHILIPMLTCEKFNAVVAGTATPIPIKGLQHVRFLKNEFAALTARLEAYLKPQPADLQDPEFFARSTTLLFYVVAVGMSQVGDYDAIGRFSASHLPDGDVQFSIAGGPGATIHVNHHVLSTEKRLPQNPRALMEFESLALARDLFGGKVNAVACIGEGRIVMRGMINMVDNLNRMLDRLALYLGE